MGSQKEAGEEQEALRTCKLNVAAEIGIFWEQLEQAGTHQAKHFKGIEAAVAK